MSEENFDTIRFPYHLTLCYLEIARASTDPGLWDLSTGGIKEFIDQYGHETIANAIFSVVSITVIFSYLALESFTNYQLFKRWEKRHDQSGVSRRFLKKLGDKSDFIEYRSHSSVKELSKRIKLLCEILDIPKPHDIDPDNWQKFKELNKLGRDFLVHPIPDENKVQSIIGSIMNRQPAGIYVKVASEIIGHFYTQLGMDRPEWLSKQKLIRFSGIDVLVGK